MMYEVMFTSECLFAQRNWTLFDAFYPERRVFIVGNKCNFKGLWMGNSKGNMLPSYRMITDATTANSYGNLL